MLGIYSSRLIRATYLQQSNLQSYWVNNATYLFSLVLWVFTPFNVPYLHSSGPIGIGITLFILTVASLSLITDFGFIESEHVGTLQRMLNGMVPSGF